MKVIPRRHERGQALVLLALGFIVMLGFTALAIDGSMVYADRRFAQNGADASSLAGGAAVALTLDNKGIDYTNFNCSSSGMNLARSNAVQAAIGRAADNDFTITQISSGDHGVKTTCGETSHGGWSDKYVDIFTYISSQTNTSFVHFVYNGPVQNSVQAVTRVRPRIPAAYGFAIVALNEDACSGNQNGVIFGGSSTIHVNGGGVWSNGCLTGNGSNFGADIENGGVNYVGTATGTLSGFSPSPQQVPEGLPTYSHDVPVPDCSGLPNQGNSSSGGTLYPGVYDKISLTNGSVTFMPGLYCVTGGPKAIKITGGKVVGTGVTFYVTTGSVEITGGADVSNPGLAAPAENPDPSPAIPGVLFYLAHGNSGTVSLEGNADSQYLGLIFVPDGDIKITGTSGTYPTFNTQLIGYNVEVSGNAELDINFSGPNTWNRPTMLELYK